jgi:hypothetical protein
MNELGCFGTGTHLCPYNNFSGTRKVACFTVKMDIKYLHERIKRDLTRKGNV